MSKARRERKKQKRSFPILALALIVFAILEMLLIMGVFGDDNVLRTRQRDLMGWYACVIPFVCGGIGAWLFIRRKAKKQEVVAEEEPTLSFTERNSQPKPVEAKPKAFTPERGRRSYPGSEQYHQEERQKQQEHRPAKESSPIIRNEHRTNVYNSEEFSSFTDGIKKQPIYKRILGDNKGVYAEEKVKKEIEENPIDIPDWSEPKQKGATKHIYRPKIDYGSGRLVSGITCEGIVAGDKNQEPEVEAAPKPEAPKAAPVVRNMLDEALEHVERMNAQAAEQKAKAANVPEANTGAGVISNPYPRHEVRGKDEPIIKNEYRINGDQVTPVEIIVEPELEQASEVQEPPAAASEESTMEAEPEASTKGSSFFDFEDDAFEQQENSTETKATLQEKEELAREALLELNKQAPVIEPEPVYGEVYEQPKYEEPVVEEKPKLVPKKLVYKLPGIDLLNNVKITDPAMYAKDIQEQARVLTQTLQDFKVRAKVINATRGPSVTRFEVQPAPGVKVNSIVNLADDIALRLAAPAVRIEAPIPGKAAIGIEVPNITTDSVYFQEVVDSKAVKSKPSRLCIGLGKNISGDIITMDICKMPHLLVAGSTGSGKSVCINTIIAGILYKARPDEVKLILVDPKVVELTNYNGIPHLLTPVVNEPKKAASALRWAVVEMERRYKMFADNGVRKFEDFNELANIEKIPYIVIVIDELSDLMMVAKADVEDSILRLAQKARAAGIHLIIATQRPSVDVITGIVKANIPSRIAFAVSSNTDSRTILDSTGAENLLGKGDMLYSPIGQSKPTRVQGAFVSDGELENIIEFIKGQSIPVQYSEEVTEQELQCDSKEKHAQEEKEKMAQENTNSGPYEDELFIPALRIALDMGQASASLLQRRFRIGFTRAGRLIDMMEELGIIGESQGSKPREVIMPRQEVEERFINIEDQG